MHVRLLAYRALLITCARIVSLLRFCLAPIICVWVPIAAVSRKRSIISNRNVQLAILIIACLASSNPTDSTNLALNVPPAYGCIWAIVTRVVL